jgi:anti-sigma regulatory factor (Ser/Thr protein kinase)
MTVDAAQHQATGTDIAFRHEALMYAGIEGFVPAISAFLREGIERDEPALVVVAEEKLDALRESLGSDAGRVEFADMRDVGANPARIIPAWYEFVGRYAGTGKRLRGVGEPINTERSPDALVECQRHESLLNLAFADGDAWWLLCPYDTAALDAPVIEEALASHPFVWDGNGTHAPSHAYRGLDTISRPFDLPLPDPPDGVEAIKFGPTHLDVVRAYVSTKARAAGLRSRRLSDLIVCVNEVATNSVRYGGGTGTLKVWTTPTSIVCEVRDGGVIDKPLAGRRRPVAGQIGGFGVWLTHQLCDLVQMRTFPDGSVVRLHMAL